MTQATDPGDTVRTRDTLGHVHRWKVEDDGTLTRQPRTVGFTTPATPTKETS